MRRWIFIAALGVALFAPPLWAQRGGHGGGGYRGGPGGGGYGGGYHGGSYSGGGYHGGYGHGYGYGRGYGYGYGYGRYPYYGRYGYGYRGYGYGWYGYPWFSLGWYGGGYSGAYYSYPATSYPAYVYSYPDNSNPYVDYNQQQEINQLNDEVARLRAEQQSGPAARPVPQPPPRAEIHAATVLVFRDRHSEEIQNYAVVGKTLWVFTEQRSRKIPIAELNVPATTKANEARGIDFRLPTQ